MKIEMWPIEQVRPYDRNPRENDGAVEAVAASIREFGWRQPIVVDRDNVIVVGHTRWKAAQRLGLKEVPVHVAMDLTPDQIRAYRIADNKLNELASWDKALLPLELSELKALDFDLALLGFSKEELANIFDPGLQAGQCDPDAIPLPPDAATTKAGEIIQLGEHRLMCGNSSNPEDVDRLLCGQAIHLVNTDPPYNVRVEPRSNNAIAAGLSSFQGATHHQGLDVVRHPGKSKPTQKKLRAKDRPLANDFVSESEFDKLLNSWFGNMSRVLQPGRSFFIWGGYANCANYPPVLKTHQLYFSQAIIWVKEHPVLTRKDFMGNHEWCQPADTGVLTPNGRVALGSLRDGDRVVSFSRRQPAIVGLDDGLEVRTTSRHHDGALYGVSVGDRLTWCTGGHIWSVRMAPEYKAMSAVCLLRRGPWWRLATIRLGMTAGFGLKAQMERERGDEAWILSVHGSHSEAQTAEHLTAVRFGLPTMPWHVSFTDGPGHAARISQFYEELDGFELDQRANLVLQAYRREREYPFFQVRVLLRDKDLRDYGRRPPVFVRGCNLLPGLMMVPVLCDGGQVRWERIRAIDVQQFSGRVHSLAVATHQHYIADGIVTHNCFYGWREGAGHKFFGPNNVPDVWPVKKVNPQSMVHLTEKPVELAVRAMQYSSLPGENVLDLFGGSGSTLIAAEQTGRKAFLMELDPLYCDVIVQRFEQFTGQSAVRIPDQS